MRWHSLRLRLIAGGVLAIVIALVLAALALTMIFERHLVRTVSDDLDVYLKQLVAGLDLDPTGRLVVNNPPGDPRFSDPLSGLYWQVAGDGGQVLRSRSLWDATLDLPPDDPAPGEVHHHRATGPAGSRLQVSERRVGLRLDGRHIAVRLAVASDLARIGAAQTAFAADLLVALGVLGVVLALATSVQVALGLRPLDLLRGGIADIRSGRTRRLPAAVPPEVGPLVEEVNALLAAQEHEVARSRGRAADLAHGLKTPLAALAADAARLRAKGDAATASGMEVATEQMRDHVDRELARARIGAGIRRGANFATPLLPLARSLVATLARTPAGETVRFELDIAADAAIDIDRTDLAEVLGNLLQNAARHARSRVRMASRPDAAGARIAVEDDGPGIEPDARAAALRRGGRLDERGSAGLGLAIVQEVLEAYGWTLDLAASELGGLCATIAPGAPGAPGADAARHASVPTT